MVNKGQPLVSVIMNCYNGEKYLREAIDSVYAQSYDNWEIIFWDNVSTDKSAEIAKSYDKRLKYYYEKNKVPLGAARNKALNQCNGDYIAFLDVDDLWMPEKLENQIPLFKDKDVGLVYSDAINFNNKGKEIRLYKTKIPYIGYVFHKLLTSYFLNIQTVIIRKSALPKKYWFDERFSMIEEADLFTRISYNWKLDFIDKPLAKWRVHSKSLTFKKSHNFPKEKKMMLNRYNKVFDNFENEYNEEINIISSQINYRNVLIKWEDDRNNEARILLKPYIKFDKKYMLLYLLTYFPFSIYKILYRFKNIDPN